MPGPIVLFGSGETSANAQRVYHWLFQQLASPVSVAVLETPAGFQPNSAQVAADIAQYMEQHLVNFGPRVAVVPARTRNGEHGTDSPAVLDALLRANVLIAGPGSPTYAVKQLGQSPAWDVLRARHRHGAALVFSSAATLAISKLTLPVYEIYKVGEDLHWQAGLDLLGDFGLSAVIISHWNNNDGGAPLDTSRCYMGVERFARLLELLPPDPARTLIGIDENTALAMIPEEGKASVFGAGGVTVMRAGEIRSFAARDEFPLSELGALHFDAGPQGIDESIWARADGSQPPAGDDDEEAPPEVLSLLADRSQARVRRDWHASDRLRDQIAAHGWRVTDTPAGQELQRAAAGDG